MSTDPTSTPPAPSRKVPPDTNPDANPPRRQRTLGNPGPPVPQHHHPQDLTPATCTTQGRFATVRDRPSKANDKRPNLATPAEIAYHITRISDHRRLCDGRPAGGDDIPTGDTGALREARAQATLCPTCQLKSGYPPFHLQQSRYRAGHRTLAHLYTVPVLNDIDNIRNCPRCRESPSDCTCRARQEARQSVRTLRQEARRFAREVTELNAATGGCAATIYQFLDGSVGYFAPDAPMWREAGDVTGQHLEKALEILQRQAVPGGKAGWPQDCNGNR